MLPSSTLVRSQNQWRAPEESPVEVSSSSIFAMTLRPVSKHLESGHRITETLAAAEKVRGPLPGSVSVTPIGSGPLTGPLTSPSGSVGPEAAYTFPVTQGNEVAEVEAIFTDALERSQALRREVEAQKRALEIKLQLVQADLVKEKQAWEEERRKLLESFEAERSAWREERHNLQQSLQKAMNVANRLPPTAGWRVQNGSNSGDANEASFDSGALPPSPAFSEASSVGRMLCFETGSDHSGRASARALGRISAEGSAVFSDHSSLGQVNYEARQ